MTEGAKTRAMTFKQGLLFVVYYAVSQLILVLIARPVLREFFAVGISWRGLLLLFALLACCGPVFAVFICWFRRARHSPRSFAIRFGLSMCAMVILYASAVALGTRALGLLSFYPRALVGYFATVVVFGVPIFSLTAYFLKRAQI